VLTALCGFYLFMVFGIAFYFLRSLYEMLVGP
jgi:hypothetical protein